jgi:molecular chaperone GrpE
MPSKPRSRSEKAPHAPGPAAQPPSDMIRAALGPEFEVLRRLAKTVPERLEALQSSFDAKIREDATKDAVIDRLHQELRAAREDPHFTLLRPIFMDLIAMHDDLNKLLAQTPRRGKANTRFRESMASFLASIEDTLARYGVTPFNVEGDELVPQRQRVTGTVPTTIAGKAARVAERRRPGFVYNGRILRPELVATYRRTGPLPKQLPEENP